MKMMTIPQDYQQILSDGNGSEAHCQPINGLKVMFAATIMDAIGTMRTRWVYTVKVVPFVPHFDPVDWSVMPITNMLIY